MKNSQYENLGENDLIIIRQIETHTKKDNYKEADNLFYSYFGKTRFFQKKPAFEEGIKCLNLFIGDENHRIHCKEILGLKTYGWYLNEMALYAHNAGELSTAFEFANMAINNHEEILQSILNNQDILHGISVMNNLAIHYIVLVEIQIKMGKLDLALKSAEKALTYANKIIALSDNYRDTSNNQIDVSKSTKKKAKAHIGYIFMLMGKYQKALSSFESANEIEKYQIRGDNLLQIQTDVFDRNNMLQRGYDPNYMLYSLRGIQFAETWFRLGKLDKARNLANFNLDVSRKWNLNRSLQSFEIGIKPAFNQDVALCFQLLGRIEAYSNRYNTSEVYLKDAAERLLIGGMRFDLARNYQFEAELYFFKNQLDHATSTIIKALEFSELGGYHIVKCDCHILQCKLKNSLGLDCLSEALNCLKLAIDFKYKWGERDSHYLLYEMYAQQGKEEDSKIHYDYFNQIDKEINYSD